MRKLIFITAFLALVLANDAYAQVATLTRPVKVPILIYHSVRPYYPGITNLVKEFTVPPDIFDEQLKYMHDNGFTLIKLDDLNNYFISGKALPQKPFVITLDDGWENQFRYAFPILKKYNDSAVFYIYSNAIETKHFLTWNEVNEMMNAHMVIGDHTKSHPELPKVADDKNLRKEIIESKKVLESKIGKTINDFAYPFGEYNDSIVRLVAEGNYKTGRGVHGCTQQSKEAVLTLCGIIVTGDFNRFVSMVNK